MKTLSFSKPCGIVKECLQEHISISYRRAHPVMVFRLFPSLFQICFVKDERELLTSSWFLFKGLIVFIHEAISSHQMDIVLKFNQYPSLRIINILNEDRFMHLLWLNFIHVSIWFLLLKLSSTSSKQRKIKFEQRIKLNYNTMRKQTRLR